eukprot:scaffold682401_cov39-Prasinocladus_malaysianus.AAC.2
MAIGGNSQESNMKVEQKCGRPRLADLTRLSRCPHSDEASKTRKFNQLSNRRQTRPCTAGLGVFFSCFYWLRHFEDENKSPWRKLTTAHQ